MTFSSAEKRAIRRQADNDRRASSLCDQAAVLMEQAQLRRDWGDEQAAERLERRAAKWESIARKLSSP